MIKRVVSLPEKGSFFLFGPRQTGKSTLINAIYPEKTWIVNLLQSEVFLKYSRTPHLFRLEAEEQIKKGPIERIFIDEVQRLPVLLNEVHYLIEHYPACQFILTGSSARKLKRVGTNLLAGRAVERFLFPFTYDELGKNFSLEDALQFGTLPAISTKSGQEKIDTLTSYTHTYLQEEIKGEALTRNIGNFSRFLEVAAAQFGELVNFSSIARDAACAMRTVQAYYEILEDTLIGLRLEPWRKSLRKRLNTHVKFYFFDNGVTNAVNRHLSAAPDPFLRGRLFEQFIIQETERKLCYAQSEASMFFWRTNHGAEVDLLIEKHGEIKAAVEIKSNTQIARAHLSGLKAFREDYPQVPCFLVANVDLAYELDGVKIIPWREYLDNILQWL
jgi:predicted AAA+ superfamily ATPase